MTPTERPVAIGIVGCGHWGRNYARVFDELVEARVVEVSDPNRKVLNEIRSRYPLVNVATERRQLIDDPRIEAVVIATPASTHFAIAREALEAGKHTLVEKPLALAEAECHALRALARARGRVLMVGHTFLYNPGIRKMKEVVRARETFGDVYYLAARRNNLGPIREDASAVWDLAPHDIAIFDYLLGEEPTVASAVGGCYLRRGRPDVAFITLTYPRGVVGHVQVSWVDSNKIREVVAIGSKRRVVFDDVNPLERIRIFEKGIAPAANGSGGGGGGEGGKDADTFGEFQYLLRDGDILSPRVEAQEPLKVLCQHFLECVRKGQEPLTGAENGARVVRVLEAIQRSLDEGGAPMEVRPCKTPQPAAMRA